VFFRTPGLPLNPVNGAELGLLKYENPLVIFFRQS